MAGALARFVDGPGFTGAVQALIAIHAVALGLEAIPDWGERFERELALLFGASTLLFIVEIALRIAAHGRRPQDFLREGWNVFDLVVVLLSVLPLAGGALIVARLLRLLRLLRLVSGTSLLRGFVAARLPVASHLVAAATLLALSVYAFAIAGFHLAGGALGEAPAWADLGSALRSVGAWSLMLDPPALPDAGHGGSAWLLALFGANLAWLVLLLRGLWDGRAGR